MQANKAITYILIIFSHVFIILLSVIFLNVILLNVILTYLTILVTMIGGILWTISVRVILLPSIMRPQLLNKTILIRTQRATQQLTSFQRIKTPDSYPE